MLTGYNLRYLAARVTNMLLEFDPPRGVWLFEAHLNISYKTSAILKANFKNRINRSVCMWCSQGFLKRNLDNEKLEGTCSSHWDRVLFTRKSVLTGRDGMLDQMTLSLIHIVSPSLFVCAYHVTELHTHIQSNGDNKLERRRAFRVHKSCLLNLDEHMNKTGPLFHVCITVCQAYI